MAEAHRTLVKSPPELWSELSDPDALSRHLGELGEIRIVRTNPEERVEWEARDSRGMVEITPAGWGTRVRLSVTIDRPASDSLAAAPAAPEQPPPPSTPPFGPPQLASPPGRLPRLLPAPAEPPAPAITSADAPSEQPTPQTTRDGAERPFRAFLSRLRSSARSMRARGRQPEPEAPLADASVPEKVSPSADVPSPEPVHDALAQLTHASDAAMPEPEPSAETAGGEDEEDAAEHVTAVLSAVLDRLGEAHHRPFSRA